MFKIKEPVNEVYTDTSDEPYKYHAKKEMGYVNSVPWKVNISAEANMRWNYARASLHLYSAKKFLSQYISNWDLYTKHGKFRQIQSYLDMLVESVNDLPQLSKMTRHWVRQNKVRQGNIFGKSSLEERQEKRFKSLYKDFFSKPVLNGEGLPLEGSCIADSSLYWTIERNNKNKDGSLKKPSWCFRVDYGQSRETFDIDQTWKENVGYNGLAVSDRKIVTCAFPQTKTDVNGIPMIIYKALWFQRKSNPTGLVKKNGYIVRLGYKDNPISIKTTEHYSQCKKIAENSATREFFKRMVNSD